MIISKKNTLGAEPIPRGSCVIPAKAGIHKISTDLYRPACRQAGSWIKSGMTASLFIIFFLFAKSIFSFTNGFNVTSDDELITLTGEPGKSYSLTVNLETSDPSLTAYPIGLDLPSESSYSATNSWITFSQSPINLVNTSTTALNFTVTIPANTSVGEYYKAVAVSDIAFVDGESSNPPTLLAVPITIQVSETATESTSTTTTSSTSGDSSTTSSSTVIPAKAGIHKVILNPKNKTKKNLLKIPDLFVILKNSKINTRYSLFSQSTKITLYTTNEGNISTIPLGSIQVLNSKNNAVKTYSINPQHYLLKPGISENYTFNLNSPKYLLGYFKAVANLGDISTQSESKILPFASKKFIHLGTYPLIAALTLFFALLFLKNTPTKKFLILVSILTLLHCYCLSNRSPSYKYLGDQVDLSVSATLKEQLGVRSIVNNDLSKSILFTSTNPSGSRLYSLNNNVRTSLDEVLQYTYGRFLTNLSYPQSDLPQMMITKGF